MSNCHDLSLCITVLITEYMISCQSYNLTVSMYICLTVFLLFFFMWDCLTVLMSEMSACLIDRLSIV